VLHRRFLALLARDQYSVGISPPSYDKQFVRDYLETLDWDKTPPAPRAAGRVIARTSAKYARRWKNRRKENRMKPLLESSWARPRLGRR
jgi:phosphoribosylaminoimidazole-succinocarboxamide synthase